MKIKNYLSGIALLLSSYALAQPSADSFVPSIDSTLNTTGIVVASPSRFDMKSFARVQIYFPNDTVDIYTGPTGTASFDLPSKYFSSDKKYFDVFVQPTTKGDDFPSYHSYIELKKGYNDLIELFDYSSSSR